MAVMGSYTVSCVFPKQLTGQLVRPIHSVLEMWLKQLQSGGTSVNRGSSGCHGLETALIKYWEKNII